MTPRLQKCIGFGEFDGKCDRPAGCKFTPVWCERCDELRRAHISRQFEEIGKKHGWCEKQGEGLYE